MQPIQQLLARQNSILREQEWKAIDTEVVTTARAVLQGRRIFAGATKVYNDPGVVFVEWPVETGDMSDAIISIHGEDETQSDSLDTSFSNLQVPLIQKDWEAAWRLVEAARRAGRNIPTDSVARATETVARTEETHVATGKGGFKGLLNATGIETNSGGVWSGTTLADWESRHNDILQAITDLQTTGFYGRNGQYQVLVNAAQFGQIRRVNGTAGRQVVADIEATIGQPFAQGVIPWDKVPANKVYVRDPSPINADLIIGFDARSVELPKTGLNYRGRVMEAVVTRVKRAKSIVEITVT